MTYHRIITDKEALEEFIEWLPDLDSHEAYLLHLQGRKKYAPELDLSDLTHLANTLCTKRDMISKIERMETKIGTYITKRGTVVPDHALTLYVTPNPRDLRKACVEGAKRFIDLATDPNKHNPRPDREILSVAHKCKSRSCYVHFDLDRPNPNDEAETPRDVTPIDVVYETVVNIVGSEATTIVETRGGMHVLIEPKKVQSEIKNWHGAILKHVNADQTGDMMLSVVGCNQGGFTPRFYNV